jgi:flagellar assembly protein FliH
LSKRIPREESASLPRFETLLSETAAKPVRKRSAPSPAMDSVSEMLEAKRASAHVEGYGAGYQLGFKEGLASAKKQEAQLIENFANELRALVERVEKAMNLWYEKAEYGLASLAFEIAKNVLADEISARPEAIVPIARQAIQRVNNSLSATIRINPFDLPALERNRDAICAVAGLVKGVEIVGDETLSRGSVVVESESGIVDATVETKLQNIQQNEAA